MTASPSSRVPDVEPTEPGSAGVAATSRVVATAGHVDHGKSTLIRRLTGIEPDRLEEERRRGLTIDLGYAWMTLPSGRSVGFVDVPGHERFVRTMLAGVGPVRLVLFVVAADEGWSRQSEEHLAIVDVLGVDDAVIALTKRDAVDDDRLAAATDDVRTHVAGTALEHAAIVACSAVRGDGLDDLVAALDAMIEIAPHPEDLERPRLFVDRVFTIAGAGTVVTGTLTGGSLVVGDPVELSPGGERGRIRGLQSHEEPLEVAAPVARVAVNLSGIDRERIDRGDVLGHVGGWRATDVVEARVTPVRGLEHPLGSRGAFTFHAGSAERDATVRVYGGDLVGDGAFVRIRLSSPLALDVFDRFVLRESGRRETVAGGIVLDPDPPARPGRDPERRLEARRTAARADLPRLAVAERGAIPADPSTPARSGVVSVTGWWLDPTLDAEIAAALGRVVATRDRVDIAEGRSAIVTALRSRRVSTDATLVDALLDANVARGTLVREGAEISLPGRVAGPAADAVDAVVSAVASGEPTPPALGELRVRGFEPAAIEEAIRSGALVRIGPELVVTRGFVDRAVEVVRAAGPAGATVSTVRAALGTSRKYAVPLMEHLDRTGQTRREGDLRFARGSNDG
jgi:selenocysteine-specific elongation factor